MKLKTILVVVIIIAFTFLIYLSTIDKQVYYVSLSDNYNISNNYGIKISNYLEKNKKLEKYISEFDLTDYRITDLIRIIEENKKIKIKKEEQTIKNALIKSDLLTLFIGMNDINYKIGNASLNELYDYMDTFLKDIEKLFIILREYCKEDIIMLNYYNIFDKKYDEIFIYVNKKLEEIGNEYNIKILDLSIIVTNKNINNKKLTEEENELIYQKILDLESL